MDATLSARTPLAGDAAAEAAAAAAAAPDTSASPAEPVAPAESTLPLPAEDTPAAPPQEPIVVGSSFSGTHDSAPEDAPTTPLPVDERPAAEQQPADSAAGRTGVSARNRFASILNSATHRRDHAPVEEPGAAPVPAPATPTTATSTAETEVLIDAQTPTEAAPAPEATTPDATTPTATTPTATTHDATASEPTAEPTTTPHPHPRSVNDLADRLDDSRFFSSLFDFTFTSYVTRKLAGPVYVVGLVLIGLAIVVGFSNSLSIAIATHSPAGAFVFLLGVLITLVGAILAVLLLRVGIEVFCAIIEIAQNTRRRQPPRE